METENQESQPSNAMAFGLLAIVLTIILVVIFTVDFSGGPAAIPKEKEGDGNTEQGNRPLSAAAKYAEGKSLFKSNCAACHNAKADGTGPALLGARARWQAAGDYKDKTGEQWMYEWVKDWNSVVAAGYPHAVEMANSRATTMNSFPYLREEEIDQILLYIDSGFTSIQSAPVP